MEHKSERMMQTALANEWKAQVKPEIPANGNSNKIVWVLYALRDQETLKVTWIGNLQTEAVYTFGDYRLYPAGKAKVLRLLTGRPDLRRLNKVDVTPTAIPFSQDSPAIEILIEVLGKTVYWKRKLDGEITWGTVHKDINLGKSYFRVYSAPSGRRILEFQDREGFHAAALEQIVRVE